MRQDDFIIQTQMRTNGKVAISMSESGVTSVDLLNGQIFLDHKSEENDTLYLYFRDIRRLFEVYAYLLDRIYEVALSKDSVQERLLQLMQEEGCLEIPQD